MSNILLATTEIESTGGMASHLHGLSLQLRNRGWEVHCVATNNRGDYFDEMNRHVPCHDLSIVPLSPNKVFMAADLVNAIKPDVVVMNNCALMQYAIPLIEPTIRPISVLHSDDSRFYAIAALCSNRVFRWIAPTAGLAAHFQRFVKPGLREKIRIIPHGIDQRRFFPKPSRNDGPACRILFVGFLGKSKGADLLPDIFHKVAATIPDAFLTVIGDGPLRTGLEVEFKKRGLQNNVLMRGISSPDQTADTMRASDILLHPTNLEGFGIAVVEAMMCGVVPVVSRLIGVTDQLIQDGRTGLLVAPQDIDGFANAVKSIYCDRGLLREMSAQAQQSARTTFSLNAMINSYEALFAECDDRSTRRKQTVPGWYAEAAVQFLRKRLR